MDFHLTDELSVFPSYGKLSQRRGPPQSSASALLAWGLQVFKVKMANSLGSAVAHLHSRQVRFRLPNLKK
jgi:hypothetical protein